MRLKSNIVQKLIIANNRYFGDAHLYLFGSRADDSKKGGDIDLFVESQTAIDSKSQTKFLTHIYRNITERNVDLIVQTPNTEKMKIFTIAKQTGIKLC